MSIDKKINEIKNDFLVDCKLFQKSEFSIIDLKNKYLGRKGSISAVYSMFASLPNDEKAKYGLIINNLKSDINSFVLDNSTIYEKENDNLDIDITLPGKEHDVGSLHPLTIIINDIKDIFKKIGFSSVYGPEVDTDYYNFEALNIPEYHPARDMQDTFYIDDSVLLRTHTSSSQIHHMLKNKPPIRIISPGKVYRNEDISVRSYCLFHQIEGLYVDNKVSFSDLKGTLEYFAKEFFGNDVKTRFRPSYFPFTEPSAEVDIGCSKKNGELKIGSGDEWLEILGSGMVNPRVLENCGLNPDEYQGFAFGMGLERIAMLKYGIPDLRPFFDSDLRWMKHYGFFSFEQTSIHQG